MGTVPSWGEAAGSGALGRPGPGCAFQGTPQVRSHVRQPLSWQVDPGGAGLRVWGPGWKGRDGLLGSAGCTPYVMIIQKYWELFLFEKMTV